MATRRPLVVGLCAVALAGCGGGRASDPPEHGQKVFGPSAFGPGLAGQATPPAASFYREDFGYHSVLSIKREANLYRVLVLEYDDRSLVGPLRAANPRLKIYLYQDDLLTRHIDEGGRGVCTALTSDLRHHPDWFLRDQHGKRIIDKSYPGNYLMDVGNVTYRNACVAHMIAITKRLHFDGLYMDDVTPNIKWVLPDGVTVPRYPTGKLWRIAMSAFARYASQQIHAAGLPVIANIGGTVDYPGLWAKWGALFDGSEEQSFTNSGNGVVKSLWAWPAQLANAQWSQAHHKIALLHSYSADEQDNTFGLATMLLVAGGELLYSTANRNFSGDEEWYPEYTTAERLGRPTGPYQRLASGVYEREFARGVVLVNPVKSAASSIDLGSTYSGSGLHDVRSVTLGPASAVILKRVGS